MDPSAERVRRLGALFHDSVSGRRQIKDFQGAKLFLEAADALCKQKGPSFCFEHIVASANGVGVVGTAVRAGLTTDSVKTALRLLIVHLLSPEVKAIGDGQFLRQLLVAILSPPTFWNALFKAHMSCDIQDEDLETFAQLCLEIVTTQDPLLKTSDDHVRELMQGKTLSDASSHRVRVLACRIQKVIDLTSTVGLVGLDTTPGGRHDNDFADFRRIKVLPTADEIRSVDEPFLQRLDDVFLVPTETREGTHRDWLYRLLREDMLEQLRDDLLSAFGQKKARRAPKTLKGLGLATSGFETASKRALALPIECADGVDFPKNLAADKRMKFVEENKNFLKHQSLVALCSGMHVVAFGSLMRDAGLLCKSPPVLIVQFPDIGGLRNALEALMGDQRASLKFFVVETATFAYEPVLERLKEADTVPLMDSLLDPKDTLLECEPARGLGRVLESLIEALRDGGEVNLSSFITMAKPIRVRGAQLASLVNGLGSSVGQIQGPPGTGKSFIGALIVLLFLRLTNYRVLVLSYTNHALDQFITDLIDIGIDEEAIVRLGSKSTPNMQSISLFELSQLPEFRPGFAVWQTIKRLKVQAAELKPMLRDVHQRLESQISAEGILAMLEFSEENSSFWRDFQVPHEEDGFHVVGKGNRRLEPRDLYSAWLRGRKKSWGPAEVAGEQDDEENGDREHADEEYSADEEVFDAEEADGGNLGSRSSWELPIEARLELHDKWSAQIRQERINEYMDLAEKNRLIQQQINKLYEESKRKVLRSKRVIGCTTTGASMYQSVIAATQPDIVVAEEAGEILEAHVIAALGPSVKQLCLIGDHKQLRPKVSSYKLTVEKGDGYNLNMSLFERLILQGHEYTTLQQQHRSHPDVSHFTRLLAYENLEDIAETANRPMVRGLKKRVVFVHHEKHEDEQPGIEDRREASKTSKSNTFEAEMVLKLVKFFCQQGYRPNQLVVLVPYLGQLSLLRRMLSQDHNLSLNDLDQAELVRAGLAAPAVAGIGKIPIRLSTIDNYQGEESDVVIVSLTRSNAAGDIGFMSARERLVVLMSRARDGIVLFGNLQTLMKSKKGGELWTEFGNALKDKGCLFEGVPVHCEKHPERSSLLQTPEDFDRHCPDGGCNAPCDAMLSCGKHTCPRRCHWVQDHSKVPCTTLVEDTCDRGHETKAPCARSRGDCEVCLKEDEDVRRRAKRDLDLERKRQASQEEYRRQLELVEDEIDLHQRAMKYEAEEVQQGKTLSQKQVQLQNLRDRKARMAAAKEKSTQSNAGHKASAVREDGGQSASAADQEWRLMKSNEGASNPALDELMDMIGLESVKEEFLSVKSSIDIRIRQQVSLMTERLSCALLGNPGTGKTTVARLWGKFLSSVGAVPGDAFEETTGAKLANGGVSQAEKMLEKIQDDGGGVLFIDEAYQLSSGNSPGGKAVMDYLLAEVENLRGKVVFVLAGYRKQMETFFAHNPGLPSRFPIEMSFDDYSDDQLLKILEREIYRRWDGKMAVEGGADGLFSRIAARRVGRGRGTDGFGNARAIENSLAEIGKRQVRRLRLERRAGAAPDDFLLTKEDVIGPEPTATLEKCGAWKELNAMLGLEKVKEEIKALLESLTTNYQRELSEEPPMQFSLNRVFLGSPGTGKTTVAKLYGRILADLGLLSNGEVVVKTPTDFIGSHLGASEAQTKGILAATVGKVLVIDEAYGLHGGKGGTSFEDPYRTAAVDTIVAEVQNVPGEDRCVILVGYQEPMEEMFQQVNPGLSRRFAIDSPFVFEDFKDEELLCLLSQKLKSSGFSANAESKKVAIEVLARERNRPNFGNGGAVENLLSKAKLSFQKRVSQGTARKNMLEAVDFDEKHDRADNSETDVAMLFKGDVGREKTIAFLSELQQRVKELRSIGLDPKDEIPFNFLFRGPPGTGKKTTARKMGKVYFDMGILSDAKVIECSATELIGEYVGQTGPKVQKMLDGALGSILFIDEAYRLAQGHFAKEAVDELVDSMTKPKYQGKMIIILAGYVDDINRVVSINPGMSSRFPETIDFAPLGADECVQLLASQLGKKKLELQEKGKTVDFACIEAPSEQFKTELVENFELLAGIKDGGNARDVKELAKLAFRRVKVLAKVVRLEEDHLSAELSKMLTDRLARQTREVYNAFSACDEPKELHQDLEQQGPVFNPVADVSQSSRHVDDTSIEAPPQEHEDPRPGTCHEPERDAGVSDQVWHQLQLDRVEAERKEAAYHDLKKAQKSAKAADREKIIRQLLEEEDRRKQEAAVKAHLQAIGACPVGYEWIKQDGGYRCAGGSHWMSDGDLEKKQ